LFQPSLVGLENAGLSEAIKNIIIQIPKEKVSRMLENVVILGGNTVLPGFEERIKTEIKQLIYQGTSLNIVNTYSD
jgi:actin-related protein